MKILKSTRIKNINNIKKRVALIANSSWYIYNFRSNLISILDKSNYDVYCIAPRDEYSKNFDQHIHWSLNPTNVNPLVEFISLIKLIYLVNKNKIDVLLSFTPKGNLYSSITSFIIQKKIIINISGLGENLKSSSLIYSPIQYIFRFFIRRADGIFFQNKSDMEYLNYNYMHSNCSLIPGSGVDLIHYTRNNNQDYKIKYKFLFIGRLLFEKGIYDYVEAINIIKDSNKNAYSEIACGIVGFIDDDRKDAITIKDLSFWQSKFNIQYLGKTDNVKDLLMITDCIVLPSFYNEGVPRILLEAAAMELPVITTDHPGCRDAVDSGLTGLLCEKKNPTDLADKMIEVLTMNNVEKIQMGKLARRKMEREFDEKIVLDIYSETTRNLLVK